MSQASNEPANLNTVRERELEYVRARRRKNNAKAEPEAGEEDLKRNLIGLALSGGGIRSATTNLGILQALSKMGILPMVDYLSTVSGGGYIGSCLSGLLSLDKGSAKAPGNLDQYHLESRDDALFTTEWENFPFREEKHKERQKAEEEETPGRLTGKRQVKHLRTHGNFVMARHGVFARETLRSVGNIFTGIIYHLLIVLLVLFSASALYMGCIRLLAPGLDGILSTSSTGARTAAVTTTKIETTGLPFWEISTVVKEKTEIKSPKLWMRLKEKGTSLRSSLEKFFNNLTTQHWPFSVAFISGFFIASIGFLGLMAAYTGYRRGSPWTKKEIKEGDSEEDAFERKLLRWLGLAAVFLVLVVVVKIRKSNILGDDPGPLLWLFLPFAVVVGMRVGTIAFHVIPPRMSSLWTRGFRSLLGSFQAMTTYGLVLTLALALFPFLVYALTEHGLGAGMLAILSLIGSRVLAPRLTAAPAGKKAVPLWLKKFALGVAVGLFVVLIALAFCSLILSWGENPWYLFLGAAIALSALGLGLNFNKIALHYFYRDRLIETYLRTEVDDDTGKMIVRHNSMEMPLTHLHGTAAEKGKDNPKEWKDAERIWGCTAPYHLISAAINLAGSRDLTRKDRKSGYFLFSKLYCGSEQTGYQPTEQYRTGETKLARALTISGAAVASAMGHYTFFAQAFAMTLFNLRLGYWLENPAYPTSLKRKEGGVFWPSYLINEMFSNTHARGRLVNLSDGGHTGDNVGIYPLLQRRCKVVIACDAEADGDLTFGSFTEALRHAYIDRGIDVDIDLEMIRPDAQTGRSRSHCAIGRIRYPDRPNQKSWLIYLKNSLTGDEPEPVLNYRNAHPTFPHETTADLFFSDAQFESYRALGVHIAEHTFGAWVPGNREWSHLQSLHLPFKAADHVETQRATDALKDLERMLLSEEALREYYEECYRDPETAEASRIERPPPAKVAQACTIQARLMEQVFFTLRLDRYANAPDNRGWMNLFRCWGNSPTFNGQFENMKATSNPNFIEFYNRYVEKWSPIDKPIPHPWDSQRERTRNERVLEGIFLDHGRTLA
ncbi:MAG: hypothetical protein ACE5HC_13670 [Candidatus Binatia bacterium]